MATTVSLPRKLRADDVFFPAMGLLILSIVVLGFAQTYIFAGMTYSRADAFFEAPPSPTP